MGVAGKLGMIGRVRMIWKVLKDRRTPGWSKLAFVVVTVLYIVSPIDLIPDFILGFGWLDDIVMIPFLAWLTTQAAPRWVRREARDEVEKADPPAA
jgi:uncharacterized membrane protein YkvA (DUF1232 family)